MAGATVVPKFQHWARSHDRGPEQIYISVVVDYAVKHVCVGWCEAGLDQ